MRALISLFLSLCLLALAPALGRANPSEDFIRLGFIQPEGTLVNYYVMEKYYHMYLDELSKHSYQRYKLVYLTPGNAMSSLSAGEVDLLLSVEYPSPLEEEHGLIFSSEDFGYDVEALYTRQGESRFEAGALGTLEGARVGVLAGRRANEKFYRFRQDNQLAMAVQEYPDQQALLAALREGSIDLVVDTATNAREEEKFLLAYASLPVRVAAREEHRAQLEEMENSLKRLYRENPYFEPFINHMISDELNFQLTHFTPEESLFIRNSPALRIAAYGQYPPYITYDEETGNVAGIYPEVIDLLAQNSGLKFAYLHAPTYQDAMELLANGGADLVISIYPGFEADQPFMYTNAMLDLSFTFIGNGPRLPAPSKPARLVLPDLPEDVLLFFRQKFARWQVDNEGSEDETLEAVNEKEADLALVTPFYLAAERPLLLYPGLVIIPETSLNMPVSLALSADQPDMLRSLINKAITMINPEERRHIVEKHFNATKPSFSMEHMMRLYPLEIGLTAGLILLFIGLVIVLNHYWQGMRKAQQILQEKNIMLLASINELSSAHRKKQHFQEMARTDALTGLLNKAAIARAGEEILVAPPHSDACHALMIIDLDHFKEANDTLGHQRGDEILRRFGQNLKHIVRGEDAVGRFGGDEFILVLENIPSARLEAVANRIREAAWQLEPATEEHPRLSASIGIALCPEHGSTYQELMQRADQALYKVKERGRDGWAMAQAK